MSVVQFPLKSERADRLLDEADAKLMAILEVLAGCIGKARSLQEDPALAMCATTLDLLREQIRVSSVRSPEGILLRNLIPELCYQIVGIAENLHLKRVIGTFQ